MLYLFENYTLDTDRRELHRDSVLVSVEPQVFDVLHHLVRNRERVVSKDQLLAEVWHGRIVSEATLSSRINAARSALGDSGEQQRLIRTVQRKGFRFVGAAREEQRGVGAMERTELETSDRSVEQSAAVIAPLERSSGTVVEGGGERRQVTVLSCELIGSATGHMDPEDLRDLTEAYHRWVTETVARFGGFVGRRAGSMVVVFFGYPAADEDDAEQAVCAGLELSTRAGTFKPGAGGPPQCRVGIATGLVVIGDSVGDPQQAEPIGEAMNLAAQLQMLAPPNTVIVEESTKRLIGNLFDCRELTPLDLIGTGGAPRVWQVLAPSMAESRFEALHAGSLTPLVGREEDLEILLRRWRQAAQGEGRVVLIAGEPGIGKSRLVLALEEALKAEPHTRIRYFCSPHHVDSALFPFISQLERAARFEREDSPLQKTNKLKAVLAQSSADPQSVVLLADLLSLPVDESSKLPDLTPQKRKEKTLAALLAQLAGLAARRPVVAVFEDLHWIDPTSLELLALTVERIRSLPVLVVLTYRPGFQAPWTGQSNVTLLSLSRLGMREGTALVQHVSGDRMLPSRLIDEIVERTDGVPLFLEELTKVVLESSADEAEKTISAMPSAALGVPATLHALLMARLDRLGPAKRMAQIGAAIGREFSYELISAVAPQSGAELVSQLDRLVESEFVFRRGVPPQASYLFKHSLVQDAAYGTLLREPRRELHASIARALREKSPETLDSQPEIIARHYTAAGLLEEGAEFWRKAGQNAGARSANREAIAHLRQGLKLVAELPEGSARNRIELDLRVALGPCLIATQGPASNETVSNFARARALCERLGKPPEHLRVMHWLSVALATRGELPEAQQTAADLVALAEEHGDRPALLNAVRAQGLLLLLMGRPVQARELIERTIHGFSASGEVERTAALAGGQDAGVAGLAAVSWALWVLGYPDRAAAEMSAAFHRAEMVKHPHTDAYAHYYAAVLYALRGEPAIAHGHAERCLSLSEEHGFLHWRGISRAIRAMCATVLDPSSRMFEEVEPALDEYLGAGYRFGITALYVLLCAPLFLRGQCEVVLDLIEKGLSVVNNNQERLFEAELYRLNARALLVGGKAGAAIDARSRLEQALTIARAQQARSLELRAGHDLAVLLREQGRREEAHDALAPIYRCFTEGFDTPDVIAAKALLADLSGANPIRNIPGTHQLGK